MKASKIGKNLKRFGYAAHRWARSKDELVLCTNDGTAPSYAITLTKDADGTVFRCVVYLKGERILDHQYEPSVEVGSFSIPEWVQQPDGLFTDVDTLAEAYTRAAEEANDDPCDCVFCAADFDFFTEAPTVPNGWPEPAGAPTVPNGWDAPELRR